jgi:hypothetical protein
MMMRMLLLSAVPVFTVGCAMEECRSLHDCPDSMSCSSDGACVAIDEPAIVTRDVVAAPSSFTNADYIQLDVTAAHLIGRIGPEVTFDTKTVDVVADSWGITASGDGDGATGLTFLMPADSASTFNAVLTTPGYRMVDTTEAYGITCTQNEEPGVYHYDEGSGAVEVDVSEPDDEGEITVEVRQQSAGGTDVTLVVTGAFIAG